MDGTYNSPRLSTRASVTFVLVLTWSLMIMGRGMSTKMRSVTMLTAPLNIPMAEKVAVEKHFMPGPLSSVQAASGGMHWKTSVPQHDIVNSTMKTGRQI